MSPETTLDATVKSALCDKAEQMVRNGTVLLVLSVLSVEIACRSRADGGGRGAISSGRSKPALRRQHHRRNGSARDPHHCGTARLAQRPSINARPTTKRAGRLIDTEAIA